MKPILEIQHISKRFVLNSAQQPYLSLRDSLTGFFKPSTKKEDFWALNDISLDIYEGDTVGIIGKNGAGKSTLLKILSRITPPTSGKIVSRGRIASLLEVGTGFHPELTGRENVYMNGSILGMRRKEIDRNFDAIIDFAGIERFVDTPLKHYSSGMQLRLAFAVAAFLENEILIIDEVLAVGDAEFQKKCMTKMGDISQSGRTILFVSHNMAAIEGLCKKGALLEKGRLITSGAIGPIVSEYVTRGNATESNNGLYTFAKGDKPSYITKIEFLSDGRHSETLPMGCEFEVHVHFESSVELEHPLLGLVIYDEFHAPVLYFNNKNYGGPLVQAPVKSGKLKLRFPSLLLMSGNYSLDIYFANQFNDLDVIKDRFRLRVEPKHFLETGEMLQERYNTFFMKDLEWSYEP